jgi:ATP-dependent helicase HrpA
MLVDAAHHIEELKQLLPQCLLPDQVRLGARLARALRARRAGHEAEWRVEHWLTEARASVALRRQRGTLVQRVHYPPELPITSWREPLIDAIRARQVVIVAGETGSGKTTQLPKMCLEAGLGARARIGCTQPRRVAALSISRRIAEELDVGWGDEVGCKIRFSDHSRPETSIKLMTDGILLAEIQRDPLLAEYEAIIVDEAHERSLNIDFLLGYLRQLVVRRDDLKVIITSATIDTGMFARAFDDAPVIQVSGRLFPVEVRYLPLDHDSEEAGEITYVDAALSALDRIWAESTDGDVLVFMPGERDIRETCDRAEVLLGEGVEVVALYGRLTATEQQRVFKPGPRRRVVVATNIAETSLTVPRIRYVVDSGWARMNRYHPPTRTRRLPIEPISQGSANQRAGRCGRVRDGVCLRLYGEEEFQARRAFTEPEIQRCNLADVILRMKAFHLGEVETFPFLEPPAPRAIQGAYQLLEELGALDAQRGLTSLGRDLARLPVDPAIGRMILQARDENALAEVLVIAAGLSIQDPRERPQDARDTAEIMHRRFQHPKSDFLSLLNIWRAYHDLWESLKTQNQLRKFCRDHFLSFTRMREWVDVHDQLADALEEMAVERSPETSPASFPAIHRSILAGLLLHVAERKERNTYRTAGGREVFLHPGSGLYAKPSPAKTKTAPVAPSARPPKEAQARWVVAGEIVETSRVFARVVAEIETEWVIQLAPHLCQTAYDQVDWDARSGRVMARERVLLRGLVLRDQRVGYGRVNPAAATEVFIRAALISGEEEMPADFTFRNPNAQLRQKIEIWQTRQRQRVVPDLEDALYRFYAGRIGQMSSWVELRKWLRSQPHAHALLAQPEDILGEHAAQFQAGDYPDRLAVGDESVALSYAYAPSEDRDGVTVRLSVSLLDVVDADVLEWQVPALREERVLQLLRLLPKALRRPLMPLDKTARDVVREVECGAKAFLHRMAQYLHGRFGVDIPPDAWTLSDLPAHLRPRFEILSAEGKSVVTGRDVSALKRQVSDLAAQAAEKVWASAAAGWERYDLAGWDFGDLPERVELGLVAGLPLLGYPGLQGEQGAAHLRLFRTRAEAVAATRAGVARLAERVLAKEVAWLRRDLRSLDRLGVLYVTLGSAEELRDTAWHHLRAYLFPERDWARLQAADFADYVERARSLLPGLVAQLAEQLALILEKRQALLVYRRAWPELADELCRLTPPRFLERVDFLRLKQLPRYLQALWIRAERAAHNPPKDREKARRVLPYLGAVAELSSCHPPSAFWAEQFDRFRWWVEEFKVSVFAQELGTAEPVSPRRLDEALEALRKDLGQRC